MLLIFPPVAKPCEPPAGIAKLAGALTAHEISCTILDANLEGQLYLLELPLTACDTWTRRAIRNISNNIDVLRDIRTYQSPDRYTRAVYDVSRVLEVAAKEYDTVIGLADYHHHRLSPVRSEDLIAAADRPEKNPFYGYCKKRLPEVLEKTFSPRRREGREGKSGRTVTTDKKKIILNTSCRHSGLDPESRDLSKQALDSRLRGNERVDLTSADIDGTEAKHFIGFSLNYLSQALTTFAMIGFVRKEFPGLRIVLGGGLVTSWMKRPGWKNPFMGLVDHLIAGPGEGPLLDLFGVHDNGPDHAAPECSSFPSKNYLSPGFILPYSASSGCYWNQCSFCPEMAESNPYIPVPVDLAMNDLDILIRETKPVLVHLLDNAVSPALLRALAEKPLGVPWYGFARIGKDLDDPDFCSALKRSGCVMLKLGLESGDQGVLDKMRKGIDLETASRVLKNLKKANIAAYVYLLFGTPAETITEARRTLEFTVAHQDAITFLNLAVFNMPLCGQETEEYATEPFYAGDLSLYSGFKHPRGWDRKQVRQFLEDEFRKHRALAAIINNNPPVFTSNHAAFFARP